ncbi:Osteoclast-stimulating factor 1 [Phlyctochytrium planicorne]|nr:Osteoclast-stimulating factor 1 [Phlyctochytrium planicorne]
MSAPPPPTKRPGKKEIAVVRALYAYQAQNPDELSFDEGSVLYVLNKDDANWWKCRCEDKEGLVPANYVGDNTAQIENPLHEAAKRGNIAFAAELLSAGVSVNSSRGGHAEVVKMLLEQKPALNSQNKLGDTPLHLGAWAGSLPVVTMLLSHEGIQTTLKNKDGATPRELAKSDDVAALLIQFQGSNTSYEGYEDEDDD